MAAATAKAREFGFSLADLTGGKKAPRPAQPPKYAHPENASVTWSGRGRRPGWVKEALAKGKSLDEFLIGKPKPRTKKSQEAEV
jgi:DNA-binding protein H-NS